LELEPTINFLLST